MSIADIITILRIICSAALIFTEPFSATFYVLYISAGITDMIDGPIARRTGTASDRGAMLGSAADLFFVIVCFVKLLPVMGLPVWIYIWVSVIAAVKVYSLIRAKASKRALSSFHTVLNKISGALLFALPLTMGFTDIRVGSCAVCAVASAAAVQDLFSAKEKKKT